MLENQHVRCPSFCIAAAAVISVASVAAQQSGDVDHALLPPEQLHTVLDAQLDGLATLGWSGGVLVAEGEDVRYVRGFGYADRAREIPFTRTTLSPLASLSKTFTSLAVFDLERRGALSLDDSIARHLDDVPEDKRGMRVRHLLSHSSGLPTYRPNEEFARSHEAAVADALAAPLRFPPGEGYGYSNAGFTLLAAIVARHADDSFVSHVQDRLLVPHGMAGTVAYDSVSAANRSIACGYGDLNAGRSFADWGELDWFRIGTGGFVSTLDDLFRYHVALRGDVLLTPEQKERAFRVHAGPEAGLGWFAADAGDLGRLVHHGGATDTGYTCAFERYVDRDVLVAVLLNTSEALYRGFGPHHALATRLGRAAFGDPLPVPLRPAEPEQRGPLILPRRYGIEGTDATFSIERNEEHWIVEARGQRAVEALLPHWRPDFEEWNRANARTAAWLDRWMRNEALSDAKLQDHLRGLANRYGPLESYRVLGTTSHWYRNVPAELTYVELCFARRSVVRRLHWRGTDLAAIGGGVYDAPMFARLVPQRDGSYRGFHLGLGSAASIALKRVEGATVLTVGAAIAHEVD